MSRGGERGGVRRRSRRAMTQTALLMLGITIGLLLTRGGDTTTEPPEQVAAPPPPAGSVDVPTRSPLPTIEPEAPSEETATDQASVPVALRLTSFERRDGTSRGSIMRVCGVTDLPEGALIAYDVVPTSPGDGGWVTERSLPHVREGVARVGTATQADDERAFCFDVDVYGFPQCDMEPYHPLNCPVHTRVRFSVALSGFRYSVTQPDTLLELFGDSGERIGLHEDCTEGCPRLLAASLPVVEFATRAFDSCPDSLYYHPGGPKCER
jgi:hypothetical protein